MAPTGSIVAHLLVRFDGAPARERSFSRHGLTSWGTVGATPFELVELVAESDEAALARLAADPAVLEVEPDARVSLHLTPNDPYYANDPITGLGQWGLRRALLDKAWDLARGSAALTVAVVDTGVDSSHPDLAAALVPGPRFVRTADSACPAGTTNRDDNGHGTHVAGIIGATGGNGVGIAGAAYGVRVMAIKALDCVGGGYTSDIASAITYAADNGARVINVSLGSTTASSTLLNAVNYALQKNVVVVAAAGNCGAQSGTTQCPTANNPEYPAAYGGVLAVGATDTSDNPTSFSTAGGYVGIAAPGVSIVSTFPTYPVELTSTSSQNYASLRGTSQAAPLVAGIAALVLSQSPGLSGSAVVQQLRATADDVYVPGIDTKTGSGRVNAYRALTSSAGPAPSSTTLRYGATYQTQAASLNLLLATPPPALSVVVTNTGTRTWSAGGMTPVRLSSHWRDASGAIALWDGPRGLLASDVPAGASATISLPLALPQSVGSYTLELDLVQEGVTWFATQGVPTKRIAATISSGYGATYAVESVPSLLPGVRVRVRATLVNNGAFTWAPGGATPVRLAYHVLDATQNMVVWDGARGALAGDVAPGASTTAALVVDAPLSAGSYLVRIDLVREGVTWFSAQGVATIQVALVVAEDRRATTSYATQTVSRSAPQPITVVVKNTSSVAIGPEGTAPTNVASHWLAPDGSAVLWDGPRATLPRLLLPGDSASVTLPLAAPPAGASQLVVDLVQEGLAWFGIGTAKTVAFAP